MIRTMVASILPQLYPICPRKNLVVDGVNRTLTLSYDMLRKFVMLTMEARDDNNSDCGWMTVKENCVAAVLQV